MTLLPHTPRPGKSTLGLDALRAHFAAGGHAPQAAVRFGLSQWQLRSLCAKEGVSLNSWDYRVPLAESERAWVAACVDCEGTVTVHVAWNRLYLCRNVQVWVKVNMTCRKVPTRLYELCGGSLSGPRPAGRGGKRPQYYWIVTANGCRWLLPQIAPHMLTKNRHAQIVLEILQANSRRGRMPKERLVPLVQELRDLNFKGRRGRAAKVPVSELR